MITRVYIDNYRCFSNFEYNPAANELILGRNGTGKTSLFDVLRLLRELICEGKSAAEHELLGTTSTTRWDSRDSQRFELTVTGNGGAYTYAVTVEYTKGKYPLKIGDEELWFAETGGKEGCLFKRCRDRGRLYRDNYSAGAEVVMDWNRSGLFGIQPRDENTRLTWFKERIASVHCVRINPWSMSPEARDEQDAPSADLDNFVAWYRHLRQEDENVSGILKEYMRDAIEGYSAVQLKEVAERTRRLDVELEFPDRPIERYSLTELSDGQRALLALYTLLAFLERSKRIPTHPVTLCVDEPENFVALSELQPWIHALEEVADGEHAQVLIASHHPEFINHYAHTSATLFYRDEGGPVRTKPFTGEGEGGLLPAEIVARGWEDG